MMWGPERKPRPAERIAHLVGESSMYVHVERTTVGEVARVTIQIHGALSAIPSLKNSRMIGGAMAGPVRDRIRALDALFARSVTGDPPSFGTDGVHVLIISADRSRRYDLIGVGETVQDWLEPCSKLVGRKRRQRGWGVGLIDDDAQVRLALYRAGDLSFPRDLTTITISRFDDVQPSVSAYVGELLEGRHYG